MTLPGGYASSFFRIELIAQADVEDVRNNCVETILRVSVWHEFHAASQADRRRERREEIPLQVCLEREARAL
jgi:hypothetical protein